LPKTVILIYLLLVYAKAVREDLSPEVKKAVKEFATRIKQAHRRRAGRMQE
jgi:Ni,Fe-hydrogenase maturation factor